MTPSATALRVGCIVATTRLLACSGAPPSADAAHDATAPDAPVDRPTAPPDLAPVGNALTVRVFRTPDNTPPGATIFLAGSFNDWSPAAATHRLAPGADGALETRVVGLRPGQRVEFKLTRGAWSSVERDDRGDDITNRAVFFDPAHPVVALFVARWADLPAPATTRSGDVRVLRDVAMPELGRTGTVWVYLPPGYASGSERYPVTYMLDGQNLFDARASAFGREWQVDEALESLHREGRLGGVMVVGVENSPARGCEYNVFAGDPHPACADATALGDRTVAFLVDTLKPRIDREYRTRPGRDDTAVVGSSMGGSIAVRAGFSRPEVFSRVGALSPSYQNSLTAAAAMPGFVRAQRVTRALRLYQDMGSAERIRELGADVLVRNMFAVRDAAREAGVADDAQRALVIEGATHDEAAWSVRVGAVLSWLWAP